MGTEERVKSEGRKGGGGGWEKERNWWFRFSFEKKCRTMEHGTNIENKCIGKRDIFMYRERNIERKEGM